MRGPELEAGPEAAWVWYGDPGGSGSSTPGLSRADFHPQLPNAIPLRLCHQPITRQRLAMVLFIMKELSRPWKLLQRRGLKYYSYIVLQQGLSHLQRAFIIVYLTQSHFPQRNCLGSTFPVTKRVRSGLDLNCGLHLRLSVCIYIWIYTR